MLGWHCYLVGTASSGDCRDVIPEKVDLINQRKSLIQDDYIGKYFGEKEFNCDF